MTRNRAGTYIEHLVEVALISCGSPAASRAGGTFGCNARKTLLISRSDFADNSISIPVIGIILPC